MNVLVLTSKQNFVWHSMQEIIPYIESAWLNSGKNFEVSALNVDDVKLEEIVPRALVATHIVLTCFNFKIFKIAAFLRENLGLPVNFVIYVHNMATIAFWPYRNWSKTDFFKLNDIFVSSCENDVKTLNAVFLQPKVIKIPFYLPNPVENYLNKPFSQISELVYVGRLSPQKNLHNLLLAISILKEKNSVKLPALTLFGKEDDLGSPNMELKQSGYLKHLKDLVEKFELNSKVHFVGHQSRETINTFLTEKQCLAISTSLHSDENFGMAILQSLVSGNHCLISDWGGHSDFKNYFQSRTTLMKVRSSFLGPALSAQTIADSIEAVLLAPISTVPVKIHPDYRMENSLPQLLKLMSIPFSATSLEFSTLANSIYSQKKTKHGNSPMRIFANYQDPLFQQISAFYIGKENFTEKYNPDRRYRAVPWIESQESQYKVSDPHKGELVIDSEQELFDCGYLIRED